jgi:hypothetical protein
MQKQKHIFFTVIFFLLFGQTVFSQNTNDLPNGYANIQLGMSVEETKEQLLKNSDFGYHGDRDVSLVPEKNQVLIETDADKGLGSNFLTTSYFQFHNDQLYVITINLNKEKIDHYSIFTTLKEKYGEPLSVTPEKSVWKNDFVTMTLEKPLTLKYINNQIYEELQQYSTVQKSAAEITQQMFLDTL